MEPKHLRTRARAPGHYRLSTETWMTILEEYKRGATTTLLAAKWKVSEHALRKRITVHGASKRAWGDACARAGAEAWDEEMAEAYAPLPPLTPPEEGAAAATDARTLGRRVLRGVGRALDQGRLEEARALGALAASLGRIPEQDSDRVDWADFARAAMEPLTALELSFAAEEGARTAHPARVELWRRLTGSTAADPLAVKAEALKLMIEGLLERNAEYDRAREAEEAEEAAEAELSPTLRALREDFRELRRRSAA